MLYSYETYLYLFMYNMSNFQYNYCTIDKSVIYYNNIRIDDYLRYNTKDSSTVQWFTR